MQQIRDVVSKHAMIVQNYFIQQVLNICHNNRPSQKVYKKMSFQLLSRNIWVVNDNYVHKDKFQDTKTKIQLHIWSIQLCVNVCIKDLKKKKKLLKLAE